MDKKILIIVAIIAVIAVLIGLVALSPHQGKSETMINFLSNSTLKNGDAVKFQLTDSKGNPLSGQEMTISLNEGNHKSNYTITTDSNGQGSLVLKDMNAGNYTIKVSYGGNDKYNSSSTVQQLTITDNNTSSNQKTDTSYRESSSNSTSSYQETSSSSSSSSGDNSVSYDSKLNLYYDSNGVVVDPDGSQSMAEGQKYEDVAKQAEQIDKNPMY